MGASRLVEGGNTLTASKPLTAHNFSNFDMIAEQSSEGYFRYLDEHGIVFGNSAFSVLLGRALGVKVVAVDGLQKMDK